MSADILSISQIQDLVSELTFAKGPIAAKDWILTHIQNGYKQSVAMATLMSTWIALTSQPIMKLNLRGVAEATLLFTFLLIY